MKMPKTKDPTNSGQLSASFRDPSGFLFTQGGTLFRQVNRIYAENYDRLIASGLYQKLVKAGLLIPHEEVEQGPVGSDAAYKILRPEVVPFISYPYEWSFSQYKDAALATLSIQKRALRADMSLKDASAYNIQFLHGKPALIDTLSFESYREGQPWVAYRQFCQHFLAPLALMAMKDIRLGQLMRVYIDGLPLDLAGRLLSPASRLKLGLLTHIHLHAGAQRRYADAGIEQRRTRAGMSRRAMLGLIESLETTTRKLQWKSGQTEWGDYYSATNYSEVAFAHKKDLISAWVKRIRPAFVWDLGANNGVFSRIASKAGIYTVSSDIDPLAVERNYQQVKREKERNLLPLLLDLTNPSPALGWANRERVSFAQRGPVEMVFALALIHHLAISNNTPLPQVAEFFAGIGKWLVIEFVPKSDSQVRRLLKSREDIFDEYTRDGFERAFGVYFKIREAVALKESERVLYLLEKCR
jgi:ribosomal protein L11 methylase PrmA